MFKSLRKSFKSFKQAMGWEKPLPPPEPEIKDTTISTTIQAVLDSYAANPENWRLEYPSQNRYGDAMLFTNGNIIISIHISRWESSNPKVHYASWQSPHGANKSITSHESDQFTPIYKEEITKLREKRRIAFETAVQEGIANPKPPEAETVKK